MTAAVHHFCTYFDSGYVSRARVLHASLRELCPDARVVALCLDDGAYRAVSDLGDDSFQPLRLEDLEAADPELAAVKPFRTQYEYYFTLGPSLIRYVMDRDDVDHLTYLDADMRFYADPQPLFDEAEGAAVVIVGHRFPPRLRHLEDHGRFNVAWVGFANDGEGRRCLDWWRERCLEWCHDVVEPDRYADQKYLDQFPTLFDRVHELQHPGADVAPWNLADPPLTWDNGTYRVGGRPLIFFHFQGTKLLGDKLIDPNLTVYGTRATAPVTRLYRSYVQALLVAGGPVTAPRRPDGTPSIRRTMRTIWRAATREIIVLSSRRS